MVATGESGDGESKIRFWKEIAQSNTTSKFSSALSIHARLSSGLTGVQVIALGFASMICWHLFVAVSIKVLELGKFLSTGDTVPHMLKVRGFR